MDGIDANRLADALRVLEEVERLPPEHPDAAIRALTETGIRAQYAYGSANTSLAEYWFESTIAIPADDVRRIRAQHFASDDGLLTMGLATRGPGFCADEVVAAGGSLLDERVAPWRSGYIEALVTLDRLDDAAAMAEELVRAASTPLVDNDAAFGAVVVAAARGDDGAVDAAAVAGLALDPDAVGPYPRARLELAAGRAWRATTSSTSAATR